MRSEVERFFPGITQPIAWPRDYSETALFEYLRSFELDGAPASELENYLREDFRRFVYTLNMVPDTEGRLLEIGANPYFTTILLNKFRKYHIHCTNYFGVSGGSGQQTSRNAHTGETLTFDYLNNNVDLEDIPYDGAFDIVLFCEVIEHLVADPIGALRRIKDRLKPGGTLILTTPNVDRLENISKMIAGANIYDPISGYGVYGRHNREYNKHELYLMLDHMGFDLELIFSSDVHANHSTNHFPTKKIASLTRSIKGRDGDLGQYIFLRARNNRPASTGKPRWLYRSFPDNELCD